MEKLQQEPLCMDSEHLSEMLLYEPSPGIKQHWNISLFQEIDFFTHVDR